MPLPAHQVPRLTVVQMAHFKAEGFLVLPAALDPELCRRARERMWVELEENIPGMRQDDPGSWPRDLKAARGEQEEAQDDAPKFTCSPKGFHLYNAASPLFLDLFPLALWTVVEQLLGEGTVVQPGPPDADGICHGELFLDKNGETHCLPRSGAIVSGATGPGRQASVSLERFPDLQNDDPPPMTTDRLAVIHTSPALGMIQGGRGCYVGGPTTAT